jgi:hypothetical protein
MFVHFRDIPMESLVKITTNFRTIICSSKFLRIYILCIINYACFFLNFKKENSNSIQKIFFKNSIKQSSSFHCKYALKRNLFQAKPIIKMI